MSKKVFLMVVLVLFGVSCDNSGKENKSIPASLKFEDVSQLAGLYYELPVIFQEGIDTITGGVSVADIDNDGWVDFAVTHGRNGPIKLLKNMADGTFKDITNISGIVSTTHARAPFFIDVDLDGKKDLIISEGGSSLKKLLVFKNLDGTKFTEISEELNLLPKNLVFSIAASDFDLDGDLDLAMSHFKLKNIDNLELTEYLWENVNGRFFPVDHILIQPEMLFPPELPDFDFSDFSYTPAFSDLNDDGYPDFVMASDYKNSVYFLNQNGNVFHLQDHFYDNPENGMGMAIGDYDNDGDMDVFITSISSDVAPLVPGLYGVSGNRLYANDGQANFTDVTDFSGVRFGSWGWGACFADFDNDGHLDLFHVNGVGNIDSESDREGEYSQFMNQPAVFYHNNGDGTFNEMALEIGLTHFGEGRGLSCFDYDNDNDIDILISNNGSSPSLFRNDTESKNNYFRVKLEGLSGNIDAIGAKVILTSSKSTQIREINLNSNYLSNNLPIAHFGLGSIKNIKKLIVKWPDQLNSVTELENVEVNQFLKIKHPQLK